MVRRGQGRGCFVRLAIPILFVLSSTLYAQDQLSLPVNQSEANTDLIQLLKDFQAQHEIKLFFLEDWFANKRITKNYDGYPLFEVLDELFDNTDFSYYPLYNYAIVIIKDPSNELQRLESIQKIVDQDNEIEKLQFGNPNSVFDNAEVVLEGKVTDLETGEFVPYASLSFNDQVGITTDAAGNYSISLPKGVYVVKVKFVEYEEKLIDLQLFADGNLDISLEKGALLLDEVVVRSETFLELTSKRAGEIKLNLADLKRAPTFLGETDLIKQIQNLPGVVTVGEAATGFNVRGGSVDQNLILYDNLPVFNSSHVFGFLTSFNPETIRGVSFYNGGIPAKYGGRVSSVLDIKSINPNEEKLVGKMGIGLFTSNAMISTPIKKNKSAFFASLRTTHSDWLTRSIRTNYADLSESQIGFYDASFKYTNRVNSGTRLAISSYSSNDNFSLTGDTTFQWSNTVISANLNRELQNGINADVTLGASIYGFQVDNEDPLNASELSYQILNNVFKVDLSKNYDQHNVTAGMEVNYSIFNPGELKPISPQSAAQQLSLDKKHSVETGIYISDEWNWDSKTKVDGGLRIPVFLALGKDEVFQYVNGQEKDISSIRDTLNFDGLDVIKGYIGLEPRLSIVRQLNSSSSVKFGYHRIYQYLHLISNSVAVAPTDIWLPSDFHFKPQRADQFSLGYFKDIKQKEYGLSNEVFYKFSDNVVDFKRGSELILNSNLERELVQGQGVSYGFETSITKNRGRMTGSLNYTFSRSFRKISGSTPEEAINDGQRYATNFDQPHVLNLSWNYKISTRHFFTGNFTYHSGRPVTVPLASF